MWNDDNQISILCCVCVCVRASVRPLRLFIFRCIFIWSNWVCFYFRFVCIRWYRFLSHLCRSSWHRFSRRRWGEASERFTQTNRQNHYTLWNLIFRFLSERFLWNRNQSLCLCAYTHTLHNSSFSFIYWLWEWVYVFLLFRSVCLVLGQQIDIFSSEKKNSITSTVGCSTNVTRVLEFCSQKKLWSICAVICHCRMKKFSKGKINGLKCSHILWAALKHRKNAFEVDE